MGSDAVHSRAPNDCMNRRSHLSLTNWEKLAALTSKNLSVGIPAGAEATLSPPPAVPDMQRRANCVRTTPCRGARKSQIPSQCNPSLPVIPAGAAPAAWRGNEKHAEETGVLDMARATVARAIRTAA